MVQGTISSIPTSNGVYGSNSLILRRAFPSHERSTRIRTGTERCCATWCVVSLTGLLFMPMPRPRPGKNMRVKVGWLFSGGNKGIDATSERSETANEDILVFFLQLDLATRAQYALNLEQYDIAQHLRNKLTEVEEEIVRQRETIKVLTAKSEAQDQSIWILRMRADLQSAIERENYAQAAQLRDEISKLEAEALDTSAKALAYENVKYNFRLGQKVKHKNFGESFNFDRRYNN